MKTAEARGYSSPDRPGASGVARGQLEALIRLARPKQWAKNGFLFAALVFSGNLFSPRPLATVILAAIFFSLGSSAVYVFNDLADMGSDRLHPKKKHRPLAAGIISPRQAWAFLAALLAVALVGSFWLETDLALSLLLYVAINLAYSLWLKNAFLLDVFIVAAGFVLRVVAGALAIQVRVSPWLFVCTLLLALFLALCKRRNELRVLTAEAGNHRQVLDFYSVPLLDQMVAIISAATIVAYSLYTFLASPRSELMLTIPFVIYGLFRYLYLVQQKDIGGHPEEILLTDVPTIVNLVLWLLTVVVLLYAF